MDQLYSVAAVDLLPQVVYVDIDDVGHRIKIVIPDMLDNHSPSQNPPGIMHEVFQEAELF